MLSGLERWFAAVVPSTVRPLRVLAAVILAIAVVFVGPQGASAQEFPTVVTAPNGQGGAPTDAGTAQLGDPAQSPRVLQQGAWQHTVPFELPPAPNSHVPQVSLTANHMAGDGSVGVGWQLDGTSRIERRGEHGGTYIFGDPSTFWVDGQRLVPITYSSATHTIELRAEQDDNRVFAYDVRNGLWSVRVDGTEWVYGEVYRDGRYLGATDRMGDRMSDACFIGPALPGTATSSGMAVAWHLARVTDPAGNNIDYEYARLCGCPGWLLSAGGTSSFPTVGTALPDNSDLFEEAACETSLEAITYADGYVRVELEYGHRPDVRAVAQGGLLRIRQHRLTAVQVVVDANGSAIDDARYELFYVDEESGSDACPGEALPQPVGNLSVLHRVERVGFDAGSGGLPTTSGGALERQVRCIESEYDETTFSGVSLSFNRELESDDDVWEAREETAFISAMPVNLDGDPYPDLLSIHALGGVDGADYVFDELLIEAFSNTDDGTGGVEPDRDLSAELSGLLSHDLLQEEEDGFLFGDIDRDGADELLVGVSGVVGNDADDVVTTADFRQLSDGSWRTSTSTRRVELTAMEVRTGQLIDIDGDGFLDLVLQPNTDVLCGSDGCNTEWIRNRGEEPYLRSVDREPLGLPLEDTATDEYVEYLDAFCGGAGYKDYRGEWEWCDGGVGIRL